MKPDHHLAPYRKFISKGTKYMNIRQETIKLLEKHTGYKILCIGLDNDYFWTSYQTKTIKANINK